MAYYVFSDLHGRYDLWSQIKKYIKSEDIVYCLGDCCDRGPDGLKIISEVLETPNITYIKGNHEDMLVQFYKKRNISWYYNGGMITYNDLEKSFNHNYKFIKTFVDRIEKLPTREDIKIGEKNIILTHAGVSPWKYDWVDNRMWDRTHIYDDWSEGYENTYVIHGHTPTELQEYRPNSSKIISSKMQDEEYGHIGILKYASGHKFNIDTGAFWVGVATLFNLETFEPIYFYS